VEEHCVCYIFTMPSKRLNHSDTFCYVWGEQTLKSQRRNFTLLIINFMSLILGVKFVTKIKVGPLIFTSHLRTYLLTPWSRVLLEKLTSKLCS
jgi:hypothetical protein